MAGATAGSHHRRSIRLKGYDYTQPGAYFITMVTQLRQCIFGDIQPDGEMRLNKYGQIAQREWERLPRRFPTIELGAYIIMPNHVHGIIMINYRWGTGEEPDIFGSQTSPRAPTIEQFGKPVKGSIPTMVRSYKSSVTQGIAYITRGSSPGVWQRNYYEHVVRNEAELHRITQYILTNPINWLGDREYPSS